MLMVISPAKTLDYTSTFPAEHNSQPSYLEQAQMLVNILKKYTPSDLAKLMRISDKLAVVNVGRFAQWQRPFTLENSKPAIFAFMGDVYEGLQAQTLSSEMLQYAQTHLRILSGLYGLLRPLDLMQPYRLEMGTKLVNKQGKDLYAFWGKILNENINILLAQTEKAELINLASEEYFKSIQSQRIQGTIITPIFEDYKNGQYKMISFYAKRARGLMARFAISQQIRYAEALKHFDWEGYAFNASASTATKWIFRRHLPH